MQRIELLKSKTEQYLVTFERTKVTVEQDPNSDVVARLGAGSIVEVLEYADVEDRLRGRLSAPKGWVSISSKTEGWIWMEELPFTQDHGATGGRVIGSFTPDQIGMAYHRNIVTGVQPGGQAEKRGVQIGWQIHKIDGRIVPDQDETIHTILVEMKRKAAPFDIVFNVSNLTQARPDSDNSQKTDAGEKDSWISRAIDFKHASDFKSGAHLAASAMGRAPEIDEPPKSQYSYDSPGTSHAFKPGRYVVIADDARLTVGSSPVSETIQKMRIGAYMQIVYVVEVPPRHSSLAQMHACAHMRAQQVPRPRGSIIRGHSTSPPGWVTIAAPSQGIAWLRPVDVDEMGVKLAEPDPVSVASGVDRRESGSANRVESAVVRAEERSKVAGSQYSSEHATTSIDKHATVSIEESLAFFSGTADGSMVGDTEPQHELKAVVMPPDEVALDPQHEVHTYVQHTQLYRYRHMCAYMHMGSGCCE